MSLSYDPLNPIRQIGVSRDTMHTLTWQDGGTEKLVRAPAVYVWKLEDVSAADSGRTEDATMYKNRVGQIVGLELSWTNIGTAEASAIINAFDPEYIYVTYLDLKSGDYETAEFYVGNRSAPLYNNRLVVWSNVRFNLIKRKG